MFLSVIFLIKRQKAEVSDWMLAFLIESPVYTTKVMNGCNFVHKGRIWILFEASLVFETGTNVSLTNTIKRENKKNNWL